MVTKGKVKWFDDKKGYGFIELDDGSGDIFVHYTAIQADGFRTLTKGQVVEFEVVDAEKGRQATNVRDAGGETETQGDQAPDIDGQGEIREPYSQTEPLDMMEKDTLGEGDSRDEGVMEE
jgi:CspA family cold shock protein